MKYMHLVWAALTRSKARTLFTMLSVAAAFLLFGLLDSVRSGFNAASSGAVGVDRLVTISKVSFTLPLPKSLENPIANVAGVTQLAYASWFGGIFREPRNFFPNQAVSDNYFDLYPEYVVPAEQMQAYRTTRSGAVIGKALADRFGWKVGDKIPLSAPIYPRSGGSNVWTFDVVAIYHTASESQRAQEGQLFFHWDYLDEAREYGKSSVGWYIEKIDSVEQADRIARSIDLLSANSDHETKSESEQAWQVSFVNQFADVGLIVDAIMAAVFFTLILLTGNTMAQAVRERTAETAVLKTIGLTGKHVLALLLTESVLLVSMGGIAGMAAAAATVMWLKSVLGTAIPISSVGLQIWLHALAFMLVIGLVVGWLPALRGMRLRIVDALVQQ